MGAALAAAGIPAAHRAWAQDPAGGGLPLAKVGFDAGDARILEALALLVYGPGAERFGVTAAMQGTLGFMAPDKQELVVSLPGLFNQLSRVLVPTVSAWIDLGPRDQRRVYEDWLHSDLAFRRAVAQGLRQLILAHIYTQPEAWEEIGYPGPWLGRLSLPVHPLRFGEP
jgi:hypothetical protein